MCIRDSNVRIYLPMTTPIISNFTIVLIKAEEELDTLFKCTASSDNPIAERLNIGTYTDNKTIRTVG